MVYFLLGRAKTGTKLCCMHKSRISFLCQQKNLVVRIYIYFLLCGSSQHMHSILAAPEPLKFGLVLDYCFVYLTQRDKAISIQQVWCSFKH